jgi:uncharacterized repeat protein (TIGR03833 family)
MNTAWNAKRAGRGQSSTRGRRCGGRSRGGFSDRNDSRDLKPVPNIQQVIVGAPVSIVLKIDQPTGHEVRGVVAELLTRGNHPRGIKVRLQDGRVGRVQRMVTEEEARAGSQGLSWLGRNGEIGGGSNESAQVASGARSGFSSGRYGDIRVDEPDEPSSAGLSLADYVVKNGKGKSQQRKICDSGNKEGEDEDGYDQPALAETRSEFKSATSTCPVCREFEGDEVAVAHHVNSHFE